VENAAGKPFSLVGSGWGGDLKPDATARPKKAGIETQDQTKT
jgi:hypothetical protein